MAFLPRTWSEQVLKVYIHCTVALHFVVFRNHPGSLQMKPFFQCIVNLLKICNLCFYIHLVGHGYYLDADQTHHKTAANVKIRKTNLSMSSRITIAPFLLLKWPYPRMVIHLASQTHTMHWWLHIVNLDFKDYFRYMGCLDC